ncbi:MOSC domain-containing protein [Oryzobacter telluris]|uniref:MOSC domain-containing protein n=1 Tax=Oryzobacter telluris TaxID=3149179 RepID=UPI00370D1DB3
MTASADSTPGTDDPPVVVAIHVAKGRRLPMRPTESVHAEAGAGLVGDRYHGTRHRHVSAQSATELAQAAERLGSPVPDDRTRRNLTLSHGAVPTRPGTRVRVGGALLEVVRKAAPCRILDDEIAPGAARALHDRAGTILRVLESGDIAVGDAWVVEEPAS